MTGTNHGMTGAVIALLVKEPVIAVPLSFASHFMCDAIPHFGVGEAAIFQRRFNVILVADFLLAVSLMILLGTLFPSQRLVIWASMIAAASPDLMWAYYDLYMNKIKHQKPRLGKIARFHLRIQKESYRGAFTEIAWFAAMGTIILFRK